MIFNTKTGEIKDEHMVKDNKHELWLHVLDNWYPVFHPLTYKYMGYMKGNILRVNGEL